MRRKFSFLLLTLGLMVVPAGAKITPTSLRCEYLKNPQVVDVANPRLSWINVADEGERGQFQTVWEIRVASSKDKLKNDQADLWNSGKVISGQSVNIKYGGKVLSSRQDCWWQVRTWDKDGKVSVWSEPAFWHTGILDPSEWKAQWIGAPWQGEEALPKPMYPGFKLTSEYMPPPAPLLRKIFVVSKEVVSARAYVTGLGFFELYINGRKVGDDVLVPNTTAFGKRSGLEKNNISLPDNFTEYRVMYLCYDITGLLTKGENAAGAILGNGFYNAPVFWTQSYGSPRFLGQIYITYSDGSEDIIVTDQSWKASKSPIVVDLVYDGEHYDARMEQPGWHNTGFDDSEWENAAIRKTPEGKLKAHMSPTDKVMERLKPVSVIKNRDGKFYVDFGQEISGWIHIASVKGDSGRVINFDYICESPVGKNTYTMKGGEAESYAARFTWFVFRQVVISNWPGELTSDQITAEVVYSDVETTGRFESSNALFNKINRIWWRSQTDNMHGGIASDCPHRERSPYTGDGQVACVTVMHNFDARAFYTKWIQDILGAQIAETGYVPNGAPWQPGCGGGVAWGAAIQIMPWEFYLHYGDLDMLRDNYEGMKGYIRYMLTWTNEDGIMFSQAPDTARPNRWLNLGDWCAPGQLPSDDMVHTFYLWRCADLTELTAKTLGKTAEAEEYYKLAEKVRKAFQQKYYDKSKGTYGPNGGNIFALKMGVPVDQYPRVIAALKSDIAANGGHLDTGIFGTQFFFEVLSENGLHELAFEAMNKKTQPGYGWWIEQGATTTWERWDGGGSRNHPMFGGGIVWFYRVLAGMNTDPLKPGYQNIIFKPQPAGDVTFASYSNETPYGLAAIYWKKTACTFKLDISVPVGSTATVYVPASGVKSVTESGKEIKAKSSVTYQKMENGYAVFIVGSGNYSFNSNL
ncbi:MAG: family 78 glycoside hydrolase catalytic domain [Bacteroidales bacterium]|nr:family 78 glycoside hydrolase catalytic domain [Bacteroidales bacterium]